MRTFFVYTRIERVPRETNPTMKNITLSADDELIEAARIRARSEHTTLNDQFRRWLEDYVQPEQRLQRYEAVMAQLRGKVRVGRKLTRDEMNER